MLGTGEIRLAYELASEIINRSRSQLTPTYLRFPTDLGPHGIIMNFKKYNYRSTRTTDLSSMSTIQNSVTLPLPVNLQNNLVIKVGQNEMGTMGAAFSDVYSKSIDTNAIKNSLDSVYDGSRAAASKLKDALSGGSYGEAFNSIIGSFASLGQTARYFGRSGIDGLFPGAGLAFDINSGTAINPHVTIDFDGVGLKRHNFEWTFSPKSAAESDELRKITNMLHRNSLPFFKSPDGSITTSNSGSSISRGLLTYPSLVDVFFVGIDPAYFWYFKPCMIASISVNYTPQGIALNRGGRPSIVNVQVELQEAAIHTADEYGPIPGEAE